MNEQILLSFLAGMALPLLAVIFIFYKKRKMELMYNIKIAQVLGHTAAIRDHETGAHNIRVAYMASIIGEALGMKRKKLQALIKGAFLHDIGKIGIPDNILLKEGSLDEKVIELMKQDDGSHFDPAIFAKFLPYAAEFANITHTHSIAQLSEKLAQRRKKIFGL